MASRTVRRQITIVAIAEGFVEMLWQQRYKDQSKNAVYTSMRNRIMRATHVAIQILKAEPNGALTHKELARIKKNIDRLQKHMFADKTFTPMQAISFVLDMISSQMVRINAGSAKHKAFETLYYRIREFERYFDPDKTYEEADGYEAARFFDALEI